MITIDDNTEKSKGYDINKILSYQNKLSKLREVKQGVIKTYNQIRPQLSEAKSKIRLKLAQNFKQAQDGTKKNAGMEVLELWVVNNFPELKDDYKLYKKLEQDEKMLSKIVDSYSNDISSIQSEIKFLTI